MGERRFFSVAAAFVLGVWAAMTIAGLWFVGHYGRNCPYADEWVLVPWLCGRLPINRDWLFQLHSEHRIPLPRLILFCLYRSCHLNFLAGAYLNLLLLSAAALSLIGLAARRRGCRWTDVVFPAVLLSWGHWENVLSGWQIQYVLPLALVAAYLMLTWQREKVGTARLTLAGLCLIAVAACGANGLLLAAILGLSLVAISLRERNAAGLLLSAAVVVVILLLRPGPSGPWQGPERTPAMLTKNVLGFLGAAFGPGFTAISVPYGYHPPLVLLDTQSYGSIAIIWPLFAAVGLGLCACAAFSPVRRNEVAWSFWLAGLGMLLLLSWNRYLGWEVSPMKLEKLQFSAFSTRYALLLAPIPLGAYLVCEATQRGRRFLQPSLAVVLLLAAALAIPDSMWGAERRAAEIDSLITDARRMPTGEAFARHTPPGVPKAIGDCVGLLRDYGHPSFRDATPGGR